MWIPLHVHSQYSILDASASIDAIAAKAKEFGLPAAALTDHGNLFGAVEFFKECHSSGVKPIIGCEFYVAPGSRLEKKREAGKRTSYPIVLLAKNSEGYHNLCKLTSIGYLEGFYYHPRIDKEVLQKYSKGLICLSGGLDGEIADTILHGNKEAVKSCIDWYKNLFGEDFYLELQRHQMAEEDILQDGLNQESWLVQQYRDYIARQNKVNSCLLELNIPVVATNDSHYIDRSDWRAHEILLNVQSGEPCEIWEKDSLGNPKFRIPNPKRVTYPSHEIYFKSPQQMAELFSDLPEALSNTVVIADKCKLQLDFKTKHYPVFIPPHLEGKKVDKAERDAEVTEFLWKLCNEGIVKRYTPERLAKVQEIYPGRDPLVVVKERLEYEMSIIVPKEMSDYLLIVWDFINWAKMQGIPMGPGRGSGAGSIVLYLIGITDIEPLRFHLFFERFINPERISYPDIDVDICMDRRGEVINYTLKKYGIENVAQIITFGTMKAKMTIKDVGRALSVPLAKVNEIAKLVPEDPNMTLEKALEIDQDLRRFVEEDEEAARIIENGKKLEGSIRNTGIHAAGMIISGEPLTNFIPICNAKDSEMPVTQFSMKPVEMVGMLKIDFLGLKTLTAIQTCVNAIKNSKGISIDWVNLPLDDKPTFDLLNQGKTLGVFQLESAGMQDLARQLHLDRFEEIIAVVSLYRPGPMDMIPSFIQRKHGREAIENDHPWMKDILAETYGIMVYQEQVMQIASKLAKYSLGEGDVLRRAMGKKDMQQMAQQREKFRQGAAENGIGSEVSMQIFDKMEKFAAYGFNKSHAAAYGFLSYITAFLKANYPKEWMAALMTCDQSDLTKVAKIIRECHQMGIEILPPDINEAGKEFVAAKQGVRFAMSGIKGVGEGVVEAILEERTRRGPYSSFYDFFKRLDTKKVGKKVIENLVEAGCFDFTKWTRDALKMSIDAMYDTAAKEQSERSMGILSLFGLIGETNDAHFEKPPKVAKPSAAHEVLLREKELLGFFLTGHPMDAHKKILQRLSCVALRHVETMDNSTVFRTAFLVEAVKVRLSAKSQRKFALLSVSDGIAQYELPIWPELYDEKKNLILENQLLYAVLVVEKSEQETRLSCRWLDDLTRADEKMIEECDQAFDKAKHMIAKAASMKEMSQKKSPPKEEKPKMKTVCLKIDAEQIRISHLLQIKKEFVNHAGKTPVKLEFHAFDQPVGKVHIDEKWGIELTDELKKKLSSFSAILSLEEF